jgi:hypothetical protein
MFGILGNIANPYNTLAPGVTGYQNASGGGLILIFSNFVKLVIVAAGLYTLLNFILAGIGFMGAGGDPKVMQRSQERIYRSIMGLLVVAGSFVIAAIVGYVIFGSANWNILINPVIYSP